MSINSTKTWFAVDRGCKFVLFTDYIYVKEGHSVFFFIFYSKRYVDITRIQETTLCRDNKLLLRLLNFHLANKTLTSSFTYAQCQSNLLYKEIRQKKSNFEF